MTARLYNRLRFIIILILILISFFLFWFSCEAVKETENWKPFDFDFTNKEGVISAYGSLLGALLSFVAIVFLILDLFYQRRLRQVESEEKQDEKIQEFRDNIEIIELFINRLKSNIIEMYTTAMKFADRELSYPEEMNRMSFLPNTFPKLILETDKNLFYAAIRHFQPGEDWKILYVDLFKIVDYYSKTFEDLMQKHKIHLDKKFKHSQDLAEALDKFIDTNSSIRNNVIKNYKSKGVFPQKGEDLYFDLLYNTHKKILEIASRNSKGEERVAEDFINEASFKAWHDELWQPLFDEILTLFNEVGEDEYNIESILIQLQFLNRGYQRLILDSEDYGNHIKQYFDEFFSEESRYVQRLNEIEVDLNSI